LDIERITRGRSSRGKGSQDKDLDIERISRGRSSKDKDLGLERRSRSSGSSGSCKGFVGVVVILGNMLLIWKMGWMLLVVLVLVLSWTIMW
jgi:hypothetical protein